MNYTYLPSTPYTPSPTIIMTTNPSSRKTHNLISNPNVSLLVHDWVSHRPPVTTPSTHQNDRASSPPAETSRSSLATLLANLNTSALSSISATINGTARLVERGTEEEAYLRARHLENNTFEDVERKDGAGANGSQDMWGVDGEAGNDHGDGGRGCFIEGEEVRVVVVSIRDGRVADWKGEVRDWYLSSGENGRGDGTLANGVCERNY
jgi:Pyridoxamine 5'-phosphate oxidase